MPRAVVLLSIDTSPDVPAVVNVTGPVNALARAKVIFVSVPVLVKLEFPDTVKAPDWVIAPLLVTDKSPLITLAVKAMASVLSSVRLPLAVNPARLIAVEPLFKVISAPLLPPV